MSHESATVIQLPVVNERAKVVALAGIPNSGKTSLFNGLTGARQHVGNYPGVTVERKEGFRRFGDLDLKFVDLPGTYSLTTISAEERVARQVLLDTAEPPDLVVCVVDASNLERHLYLAVQLIEADLPVVIALNMVDVARSHGFRIDSAALSKLLRVPVVETVGRRAEGVVDLLKAIRERLAFTAGGPAFRVDYGLDAEPEIERLQGLMSVVGSDSPGARARAIALLESAPNGLDGVSEGIRDAAFNAAERIETRTGDPVDVIIAERRHGAAVGLGHQVRRKLRAASLDMTRAIDAVLVNRWLGLPIFLAAMYAVFFLTFTVADPLAGWIESGIGWLGDVLGGAWAQGTAPLARSLVIDGIIGGVGGVLVFLPNIVLLFLAISLLEDSGYMARAAFLMDRFMRAVGLHGKSFIPMLLGFGCSIPAIMATRTIESRRARLATMLVLPLMSCGARLPIYALIIPSFFATPWQAPALWAIYVLGILLAMGLAWLLRSTMFAGRGLPFVMELPPYRLPTLKSVGIHASERAWLYVRKAGTIILGISIVMWALSTFPRFQPESQAELDRAVAVHGSLGSAELAYSAAGRLGRAMAPVLEPMGFDWRIGTALVGAFAAKEVFVAQMGIVMSVEDAEGEGASSLREKLSTNYTPLTGLCIMIFALIATPCMATGAVIAREAGHWKWAVLQFVGLTVIAWVLTTVTYQVGSLLGF
jgi:ferrous iron transport protein B